MPRNLLAAFCILLSVSAVRAADHSNPPPTARGVPDASKQEIAGAYRAFLGRDASSDEMARQTKNALSHGVFAVIRGIVESPEARAHALTIEPEKQCEERALQVQIYRGVLAHAGRGFVCEAGCAIKIMNYWNISYPKVHGLDRGGAFEELKAQCADHAVRERASQYRLNVTNQETPATQDNVCHPQD